MEIACEVVRRYGEGGDAEQGAAETGKLWNDHPAYQAALAALKRRPTPSGEVVQGEPAAVQKLRRAHDATTGEGRSFTLDEGKEVIAYIDHLASSGAGEGRLLAALAKVMPARVQDGSDYAEVYFADGSTHSTQAMTMNPQDWRDLQTAYDEALATPPHLPPAEGDTA